MLHRNTMRKMIDTIVLLSCLPHKDMGKSHTLITLKICPKNKEKTQSCHFNIKSYSLHCTVDHVD